MNQELLNDYEKKGLQKVFAVTNQGDALTSKSCESLRPQFSQLGTLIFETIGAVGNIKIDSASIVGDQKGLIFNLVKERLIGTLFDRTEGISIDELQSLLNDLAKKSEEVALPKERPRVKIEPEIFEKIKGVLKEYLGDFTERIYGNQLKSQRIKVDEVYDEDVRRLIFALGKAAGMIIGPSKARELTNRLLALIK